MYKAAVPDSQHVDFIIGGAMASLSPSFFTGAVDRFGVSQSLNVGNLVTLTVTDGSTAVPEPISLALFGFGLAGVVVARGRLTRVPRLNMKKFFGSFFKIEPLRLILT
jgi:hypothetical protein